MSGKDKPKYIKQDPITHILTRPDMYVGSKTIEKQNTYVYIDQKIMLKEVTFSPALIRTFIEILSNAIDNFERSQSPKMTYISVNLNNRECEIKNDGAIIPIEQTLVETSECHQEFIYNHTLIFGHLLSGSNYDDDETRYTSGRNGLGAKLTNVLSTRFTVEGVDPINNLKLIQTWTDNMRNTDGPEIFKSSRTTGYTSIKWSWDLKWFGFQNGLPQDILDVLKMHVLNASLLLGLKVTLNGEKLPNKLGDYFNLLEGADPTYILKIENEQSKVFVTPSLEFEAISFVNGIQTKRGGKHVQAWVDAVCRPVVDKLNGKKRTISKTSPLTIKDVKPFFKFLVVIRIKNPEFDSQEKNELKSNVKAEPITISQVNKIMKWPIGEQLKNLILSKEKKQVIKAIASNKQPVIDGYDKANNAGTNKSKDCTLILCEGLSAKTFAVDGINFGLNGKKGRDWFGIYPLRGKMLNTRNTTPTMIKNNTVITNLINILGLDYGNPSKFDKLNYGKVCIITDADVDGIHIEGLILNFFHSLFPALLERNFVFSMKTPILRVGQQYYFDERTPIKYESRNIKYYKGLGAIEPKETEKVFGVKIINFVQDEESDNSFNIAFDKDVSDQRKNWLSNYNPLAQIKPNLDDNKNKFTDFTITRHLKHELIKYFHDACKRSIPSGIDGLKESQRKIVYTAKKCNLKSHDSKVAQFGADVAKHTNYHHGEENLFKTIIKMAQSFVGSNNIPLFSELGRFGTRLEGGEDAASARYIKTNVVPEFNNIFNPLEDSLLTNRRDDGDLVEPYYYVPVIPLLLVNGCVGVGTGWMCNIPQFNPHDIVKTCKLWMSDRSKFLEQVETLQPWYKGFNGTIEKVNETKFITRGIYTEEKGVVRVTELPIGMWNNKFKKILDTNEIQYNDRSTPTSVNFEVFLDKSKKSTFTMKDFEKKMYTYLNLDNIVVFDENDKIVKGTLVDLFDLWGNSKLKLNQKRKTSIITDLENQLKINNCKCKFITAVKNKKIDITVEEKTVIKLIKSENITQEDAIIKMLLDLPVRTLTENYRKDLEKLSVKLENERVLMMSKTVVDIWKDDISKYDFLK